MAVSLTFFPLPLLLVLFLSALHLLDLPPSAHAVSRRPRAADACARLAMFEYPRPSLVVACQDQFRFNRSRDIAVVDSIIKSLDTFYPYRHIAMNPPDAVHFPDKVDIVARLRAVRRKALRGRFATSRAFHAAMVRQLDRLNDAHTTLSNNCFESYVYRLPLPLVGVTDRRGGMTIRVAPAAAIPWDTVLIADSYFNFDLSPFFGAEVLRINGRPALQAVLHYADKVAGSYHDVGARLNAVFARRFFMQTGLSPTLGMFAQRALYPGSDYMVVTLVRPGTIRSVTLRVPWMAFFTSFEPGFTDTRSYWELYCRPGARWLPGLVPNRAGSDAGGGTFSRGSTAGTSIGSRSIERGAGKPVPVTVLEHVQGEEVQWPRHFAVRRYVPGLDWSVPSRNREAGEGLAAAAAAAAAAQTAGKAGPAAARAKSSALAKELTGHADWFRTFLLPDHTAVIAVTDFMAISKAQYVEWIVQMKKAFALARRSAKRVILDVRGNPGGIPELCWWLAAALLGSKRVPRAQFTGPLDFRVGNRLVLKLVRTANGYYDWRQFADLRQRPFTRRTGPHFFFPLRSRRWGRTPRGAFSALMKLDMSMLVLHRLPAGPLLGRLPFLVLPDGTCFSACAIFTQNLKLRYGVRHVTTGGWPGRPLALSNSCLGFMCPDVTAQIVRPMTLKQRASPYAPGPLDTYQASFGMALTNGYIGNSTPCEWVFVPGDAHVRSTLANIANPFLLWRDVSQHFI